MTDEQVCKVLAVLTTAYPSANIPENTVELYMEMLIVHDYLLTKQAVYRLLKTSKFFPTIAEIEEAIEKTTVQDIPDVEQAWLDVQKTMSKTGYFESPKFSHPAIAEAVRCIGWDNIRMSENIGVERAHFFKLYDTIKNRHRETKINNQVLQLIGNIGLIEGAR